MNPELTLQEDGRLRLRYLLHELPSAQHKAGLAGLLFLARNMQSRDLSGHIEIAHLATNAAEIVIGQESLEATLNELYAADWREIRSATRFSGKEPKRIEEVPQASGDSGKTEKRFVYDEFRPAGDFFSHLLDGGGKSPWLKLWQDMLWAVLRAQPATRGDYEARANQQTLPLTHKTWASLLKSHKGRCDGKLIIEPVAGSLFLGAQAVNAERVSFQGTVELNFLLHFWQLVSPLFSPRKIDIKNRRMTDQGYLLAIPEVSDLAEFVDDIERFWKSRTAKVSGYRPEQALIDVPQEGGLEFLHELAQLRTDKDGGLSLSISGIEWFHQEKQDKNVRMLGHGHIRADRTLLVRYEAARLRHGNPLFKHLTLCNLLAGRPWHQGAAGLCALHPAEFFVHSDKSPRFAFFGHDARNRFSAILQDIKAQEPTAMSQTTPSLVDDALVARVYQLIGAYVEHRVHERTGLRRRDFSKGDDGRVRYDSKLREAIDKVTKDAFLAMRGRNDREFVAYFTGTICSVPQYFGRQDEFIVLSQALIADPDLIKDLSMLALSAHSWLPRAEDAGGNAEAATDEGSAPQTTH
jgi:CRISPR-associated protein Cmx8